MEDPEKQIYDWCGHLSVPILVDVNAYNNCKGCNAKMEGFITKGNKHHCRLCGELYCNACTAKYHLPYLFLIKGKEGPARVCMNCVQGCLDRKAEAESNVKRPQSLLNTPSFSSTHNLSASLASMNKVEIGPPDRWEEESEFVRCPKCATTKGKTHNCRVCGRLFCEKDTRKMDGIPQCFERKAGKTGPKRVCDECRFKIVSGGAKLVERPTKPMHPNSKPTPKPSIIVTPHATATKSSGGAAPPPPKSKPPPPPSAAGARRASTYGRRESTTTGASAPDAGDSGVQITVKNEETSEIIASLMVPSLDTALTAIDSMLKKTAPQTTSYQYIFRGEPIPQPFYEVFKAKHLGHALLLRHKKSYQLDMEADRDANAGIITDENDPVHAPNNPFKRDPEREAKLAAEREEKSKVKIKHQPVFKRPVIQHAPNGVAGSSSSNGKRGFSGGKPPPPLPPLPSLPSDGRSGVGTGQGAAAALASGSSIEQVLRQRAKQVFGQL